MFTFFQTFVETNQIIIVSVLSLVVFIQLSVLIIITLALRSYIIKSKRQQELRTTERQGRIQAEKKLSQLSQCFNDNHDLKQVVKNSHSFHHIGTIQTCYEGRNGTPRQPSLVPLSLGKIKLAEKIPSDTLDGLASFSHCWLIYAFHLNTNLHKSDINDAGFTFKAKIKVPRLQGQKLGVFSTRSPHRPNPIGLSLVKIIDVNVKEGAIVVSGVDLVNDTPILDIKPYVPYADNVYDNALVPDWVVAEIQNGKEPLAIESVQFKKTFWKQLEGCWPERDDKFAVYSDQDDFVRLVEQVLQRDIRSVYQRQKKRDTGDIYNVVLDGCNVSYQIEQNVVNIVGVSCQT